MLLPDSAQKISIFTINKLILYSPFCRKENPVFAYTNNFSIVHIQWMLEKSWSKRML